MKKVYTIATFSVIVLIQLFVPTQMIFNQEKILNEGKAYKFLTRPIDPSDPFRGKYITLRYEINSFRTNDTTWQRGQDVYVYLKDSLGYAQIDTISKFKLNVNNDYVIAKATVLNKTNVFNGGLTELNFTLPFNRFYMEEYLAKPAEDAVRVRRNDTLINNVYGLVYIKDGASVLKDVYIDNVSITEYIKKEAKQ